MRAAGSSESDRTLTAVRLRYQKVLKDSDVELSAEEVFSLASIRFHSLGIVRMSVLNLLKKCAVKLSPTSQNRYRNDRS